MSTSLPNGVSPLPKQIRFVTNQGQPPAKRRRINAACLTCRKRKTRCAGEKPVCSTCSKNGHECLGYGDLVEKHSKREPSSTRTSVGILDDTHGDDDQGEIEDAHENEERRWKSKNGTKGVTFEWPDPAGPENSEASLASRAKSNGDCDEAQSANAGRNAPRSSQPTRTSSYSEDGGSNNRSPIQHHTESRKVPYFRYFGPTAIVPGYKRMLVNVAIHRDRRRSRGNSFSALSPHLMPTQSTFQASLQTETIVESMDDMPVYDPHDPDPTHPIITSLVKTFFLHLGCNYPFLREQKCLRMLQEKTMEPLLIDAMCALAARFSDLPIFTTHANGTLKKAEYGQVFAQRAKAATVDTFPCPSVSSIQAFLLMAYEGFGANQDSALWMYLGCAIRMTLDLGLQTREGVKYQGRSDPWYTRSWTLRSSSDDGSDSVESEADGEPLSPEEQLELERERTDTFWSVFMLDRVISSGTGRPVTFREDDFELDLPEPANDPVTDWPDPFPIFIRIIHLYGRVSDVLNKIRNASDLTNDKMHRLASMEKELTVIYQKQNPRLHFSVQNFQEYVKFGQGTTFMLLHVWFHALIIIIHQPLTLFGGMSRPKLLPDSRELSMSSAKTIADILAFAELIDPRSFIGNPFTSQPMYIAACAFLLESAANASQPPSREPSPRPPKHDGPRHAGARRTVTRHSILASDASHKYQSCYSSLQRLEEYWGGVGYILAALDQRSKGIWDCETFTDDVEAVHNDPLTRLSARMNPPSPHIEPLAVSLTGTTNSPNPSLTLMYQNAHNIHAPPVTSAPVAAPTPPGNMIYDPIRQSIPESTNRNSGYMQDSTIRRVDTHGVTAQGHTIPSSRLKYGSHINSVRPSPSTAHSATRSPTPNENRFKPFAKGTTHHQHHSYTPPSQPSTTYQSPVVPSNASPASTLTDHTGFHHGLHRLNGHDGGSGGGGHGGGRGLNEGFHTLSATSNFVDAAQLAAGPVIADYITYEVNDLVTPNDNWYMQGDWLGELFPTNGEPDDALNTWVY